MANGSKNTKNIKTQPGAKRIENRKNKKINLFLLISAIVALLGVVIGAVVGVVSYLNNREIDYLNDNLGKYIYIAALDYKSFEVEDTLDDVTDRDVEMSIIKLLTQNKGAIENGGATKRLFRRFDYSSIYLMIGGTFAPILLAYSQSSAAIWFFVIQWVLIATGITFIGVFGPTRLKWLHMPLYLILGWCGIMFIPEMLARGDYLLFGLILGGGAVYSIGVIPFTLKGRAAHFIWHIFVLAGAVIQWIGIYSVIYLG